MTDADRVRAALNAAPFRRLAFKPAGRSDTITVAFSILDSSMLTVRWYKDGPAKESTVDRFIEAVDAIVDPEDTRHQIDAPTAFSRDSWLRRMETPQEKVVRQKKPKAPPPKVDLWNEHARHLTGLKKWSYASKKSGKRGVQLVGGVYSSKAKADTAPIADAGTERTLTITHADHEMFCVAWEGRTSICHVCLGESSAVAVIVDGERDFQKCARCDGTGVAPGKKKKLTMAERQGSLF